MQSRPSHPHTISILGTVLVHRLCITVYPCVLLTVVITVYYTKKYVFCQENSGKTVRGLLTVQVDKI